MNSYSYVTPEYFRFEEDFVQDDIRCIPMIVRYKLDVCGIKLKLREWSLFDPSEREALALMECSTNTGITGYRDYLERLIWERTGQPATPLNPITDAPWSDGKDVPEIVRHRFREHDRHVTFDQWNNLRLLQRFALFKLSASSHEHKNFGSALTEFNLA